MWSFSWVNLKASAADTLPMWANSYKDTVGEIQLQDNTSPYWLFLFLLNSHLRLGWNFFFLFKNHQEIKIFWKKMFYQSDILSYFFHGRLYCSVDAVDFGIQVLVFRVVFGLSKAVSGHTVTLTHSSLALVVGGCRETRNETIWGTFLNTCQLVMCSKWQCEGVSHNREGICLEIKRLFLTV